MVRHGHFQLACFLNLEIQFKGPEHNTGLMQKFILAAVFDAIQAIEQSVPCYLPVLFLRYPHQDTL